jgi:Ca2+-binding RTX toxin-like protein
MLPCEEGTIMATFNGTIAGDVINGTAGADTIFGGRGDDILSGRAGSDAVYGGNDQDTLYGGDGNDTLSGGGGNDLLYGGDGDDLLAGVGGNDKLFGGNGNDHVNGTAGDDEVYGGCGNDLVIGDAGNDKVFGGDGNDRIYGDDHVASGVDQLYGGSGCDEFVFDNGHSGVGSGNRDRIEDFDQKYDSIDLSKLEGVDKHDVSIVKLGPSSAGDYLVRVDTDNDKKFDMEIEVHGKISLSNFIFEGTEASGCGCGHSYDHKPDYNKHAFDWHDNDWGFRNGWSFSYTSWFADHFWL